MNFSELVTEVAHCTGLSKSTVKSVLRIASTVILTRVLGSGINVNIPGFGTFYKHHIKPRTIMKGQVTVQSRHVVHFRPRRGMKAPEDFLVGVRERKKS
jgi:nucleoid DNA-binding protein